MLEYAKLLQSIKKASADLSIDELIDELAVTLRTAWARQVDSVASDILADLIDSKKPIPTSLSQWKRYDARMAQLLGSVYATSIYSSLADGTEASYLMGMKGGGGVNVVWGQKDLLSLDILNKNTRFWIGTHFSDNLQEGFRAVLQDYFDGGYNRADFVSLLETHFSSLVSRSESYWNLFADHLATKTREIGRVSGYEQAGVERVIWQSWLDGRTSKFCRQMNGEVIEVRYLRKGVDNYLKACETEDKETIKKAWKWWTDKEVEQTLTSEGAIRREIESGSIFSPPAHGG